MTDSPHDSNSDPPSQPERSTEQQEFGYGKPPKHSQFPKGKSGNQVERSSLLRLER